MPENTHHAISQAHWYLETSPSLTSLRERLVKLTHQAPLPPLVEETLILPNQGVAQWLKAGFATDNEQGGGDVAAALRVWSPNQCLWQLYRAVLGHDSLPRQSPYAASQLTWRLYGLWPTLADDPIYQPLADFLADDDSGRKRYQLAVQLADLYERYQSLRPDWILAWEGGEDCLPTANAESHPLPVEQRWQAALWRQLKTAIGATAPAFPRLQQALRSALQNHQIAKPARLPARLILFGMNRLAPAFIDTLAVLAEHIPVWIFLHTPCQTLSTEPRHPMWDAWGELGRDTLYLLTRNAQSARPTTSESDEFGFVAGDAADSTLLHRLQTAIRTDRPPAAESSLPVTADDHSMAFHCAHSPLREVEILHDQLLAAFAADPALGPRDIHVLVPDIGTYRAPIQAVFGRLSPSESRYIPFHIADGSQRQQVPLFIALETLLHLPERRLSVSELFDLLQVPALRTKFGITTNDLPILRRWAEAAQCRWGLHAEHRAGLGLPTALTQNTWDFGLQRMWLGYAVGAGDPWHEIEPLEEIGGLEASLLGRLAELIRTLEELWRSLSIHAATDLGEDLGEENGSSHTRTPAAWLEHLRPLLSNCFLASDDKEAEQLTVAEQTLIAWYEACQSAGLEQPVPLASVRDAWLDGLNTNANRQHYLGGGVLFAELQPMRILPCRQLYLLGMNDGDFPPQPATPDFDLMASHRRPGDPNERDQARYLFLEAILAPEQRLIISWLGRDIQDNSERPPSVLVGQLRDHLARYWHLAESSAVASTDLLTALTTVHPLQPFNQAYFTGTDARLFTYADEWRAVHGQSGSKTSEVPVQPSYRRQAPLTFKQLGDFLRDPAKVFLHERLRTQLDQETASAVDTEPFSLDGLQTWQYIDALLRPLAQAAASDTLDDPDVELQRQLDSMQRAGKLPWPPFNVPSRAALGEPIPEMLAHYRQALTDWPQPIEPAPSITWEYGGLSLADQLAGLRRNQVGEVCRIDLLTSKLHEGQNLDKLRWDLLVRAWPAHLGMQLVQPQSQTLIIGQTGNVKLPALSQADAEHYLADLFDAWLAGMEAPLPLACKTGFAWLTNDKETMKSFAKDIEHSLALARCWPDYEMLVTQPMFAEWANKLYYPIIAQFAGA